MEELRGGRGGIWGSQQRRRSAGITWKSALLTQVVSEMCCNDEWCIYRVITTPDHPRQVHTVIRLHLVRAGGEPAKFIPPKNT